MNSLPLPVPSLAAVTVPPCISTSFFTSVSPMPSPPLRAVERPVGLDEEVEDAGQHLRRDADAVVFDRDDDVPVLPGGERDVSAVPRCISRRS